jgi:hypothetical protein
MGPAGTCEKPTAGERDTLVTPKIEKNEKVVEIKDLCTYNLNRLAQVLIFLLPKAQ